MNTSENTTTETKREVYPTDHIKCIKIGADTKYDKGKQHSDD